MTTTAPLYPGAWNVWLVALAGAPGSPDLHRDALSAVTTWISRKVPDASDFALLEQPTGKVVRRRENLDAIPTLPAGPYYITAVRWFDAGPQQSIPWPADSSAMLLEVHEPDRKLAPPEGLGDKLAALTKPAADFAKTVVISLAVAAALIAVAVYVSKRPVRVIYDRGGYE